VLVWLAHSTVWGVEIGDDVYVANDGTVIVVNGRVAARIDEGTVLTVSDRKGDRLWVDHVDGRRPAIVGSVHIDDVVPVDEALDRVSRALEEDPTAGRFFSRGRLHHARGEYADAIRDFTECVRRDPSAFMSVVHRARVWMDSGEHSKAIADADEALRIQPGCAPALQVRAEARLRGQDYERATSDFREALRHDPDFARAHHGLAVIAAHCPDERFRDPVAAVASAKRACELTGFRNGLYLATLASACAAAGNFDLAVKSQSKAVSLAAAKDREGYRRQLERYKRGEPFQVETPSERDAAR
jgi:tetratricopeptide (TPR) repeat protein